MILMALLLSCLHPGPTGPSPAERLTLVPSPILAPAADTQKITVAVVFRLGSAMDPSGQEGIAALTAQMLRHGGTQTLNPEQVDQALQALNAEVELRVDRELVSFIGRAPAASGAEFLPLFVSLITQPGWAPARFDALREQAIRGLHQLLSDPQALSEELLLSWMYEAHPYGHPSLGRLGTLPVLTLEDARRFYDQNYGRSLAFSGLFGEVGPEQAQALSEGLAALPVRAVAPRTPRPISPPDGRTALLVQGPALYAAVGHTLRADPEDPVLRARTQLPQQVQATLQTQPPLDLTIPADCGAWAPLVQPCVALQLGPLQDQALPSFLSALEQLTPPPTPLPLSPPPGPEETLLRLLATQALAVEDGPPNPSLSEDLISRPLLHPELMRLVLVAPDPQALGLALFEDSTPSDVQAAEEPPAAGSTSSYAKPSYRWFILPTEGLFQ